MSIKEDRKKLKTYFEQGDRPDESQFSNLIQSGINQLEDKVHAVDGKVGLDVSQPEERLDVNGNLLVREHVKVKGHVEGDKAQKAPSEDVLYLANYAAIGLHGSRKPNEGGDISLSANAANGASGKIRFDRFVGNGHQPSMLIDGNGQVGIGTTNPDSKLHIDNGNSATTGLKLNSGAASNRILVSDSSGNASWKEGDFLTNSLWQKTGNDISNGNIGNVGIGTSNPDEKLKVNGNVQVTGDLIGQDNAQSSLDILSAKNGGGAYMHLFGSEQGGNNEGGMDFIAFGKGSNNGFNFLHHNKEKDTPGNEGNPRSWDVSLRIDGHGNSYYNNHRIFLRGEGDMNHGLGYFDDRTNLSFTNTVINGPVLFGNGGGALGVVSNAHQVPFDQASKNLALQWFSNQAVNFYGKVLVQGRKPIVMRRYKFRDINQGELSGGRTLNKSANEFGIAVVAGYSFDESDIPPQKLRIYLYTAIVNGVWHVFADSLNAVDFPDNEKWNVDIMFVRTAMSELEDPEDPQNPFTNRLD